jgi:hypothetical protein
MARGIADLGSQQRIMSSPLGWLLGVEMLIGIDRLGKPRKQGPHLSLSIPVQWELPGGAARGSCQGELPGGIRSASLGVSHDRRMPVMPTRGGNSPSALSHPAARLAVALIKMGGLRVVFSAAGEDG